LREIFSSLGSNAGIMHHWPHKIQDRGQFDGNKTELIVNFDLHVNQKNEDVKQGEFVKIIYIHLLQHIP